MNRLATSATNPTLAAHATVGFVDQAQLIVVHPGSMCGSGDFNDPENAATGRAALIDAVAEWRGRCFVIDGFLSDELALPEYEALGSALSGGRIKRVFDCAARSRAFPQTSLQYLSTRLLTDVPVYVAGAWYGQSGCVRAITDGLRDMGFAPMLLQDAVLFEEACEPLPGDAFAPALWRAEPPRPDPRRRARRP